MTQKSALQKQLQNMDEDLKEIYQKIKEVSNKEEAVTQQQSKLKAERVFLFFGNALLIFKGRITRNVETKR